MAGRLFLIWLVISLQAAAQPGTELFRFTREKKAPDGQVYLYTGMQDASGHEIIPALYDQIWDFKNDTLTLARKLQWNSYVGEMVFEYQMITRSGFLFYEFPPFIEPINLKNGLVLALNRRKMLYGYLDRQGNTVIKFRYSDAGTFNEGLAYAENPGTLKKGYINQAGKWMIPAEFDQTFGFSEGLAVVKKDGKWYYINTRGQENIISGKYAEVFDVQEGYSVVSVQRNDSLFYGFINREGEEVLSPTYEFLDRFEQGTAVFQEKGRTGMVDTTGKVVVPALYEELYRYDQQHYIFQLNGLQGLMRLDGKTVLPAKYSVIGYFTEGLCPVSRSGKWGFADTSGREVIPCRYAEIKGGFSRGRASVRMGDQWWITAGKDTVALPDYEEVLPYFGQVAPFRYHQHWGFLNMHGEESAEPKYDELIFNKNGLVYARYTAKDSSVTWSVFTNTGKMVSEGQYLDVIRSSEGLSAVKTKSGWGFIDASGIPICAPHYMAVRNFSEGRAAVKLHDEWGFISETGIEVIPIFWGKLQIADSLAKTPGDSLHFIRGAFPLYHMELQGDFKDNCACVLDLLNKDAEFKCINRIGKLYNQPACDPYNKISDQLQQGEFENKSIQVIRLQGSWIEINQAGEALH